MPVVDTQHSSERLPTAGAISARPAMGACCSDKVLSSQGLSLHNRLRETTRAVHERLHRHPGFAAVLNRTIELPAYRALLSRLLGFHLAFEEAAHITPERSHWLKADLQALGVDEGQVANLPRCFNVPNLETSSRSLGARYVIEGSALGGRVLALRLDSLLGPGALDGRRFFLGSGDDGRTWQSVLVRIAAVQADEAARRQVVAAAVETFNALEMWLTDWEGN